MSVNIHYTVILEETHLRDHLALESRRVQETSATTAQILANQQSKTQLETARWTQPSRSTADPERHRRPQPVADGQ